MWFHKTCNFKSLCVPKLHLLFYISGTIRTSLIEFSVYMQEDQYYTLIQLTQKGFCLKWYFFETVTHTCTCLWYISHQYLICEVDIFITYNRLFHTRYVISVVLSMQLLLTYAYMWTVVTYTHSTDLSKCNYFFVYQFLDSQTSVHFVDDLKLSFYS